MGMTAKAIQRPLATTMLFLMLILLGQQAYTRMRVDRFPTMSFPTVFIQIDWPGASPENIEQTIIKPAENAVAGVSGVQRIDSTAQQGSARLTIAFVEGTDIDQATIDTQRRLASIGRLLPTDATQPSIQKADPSASPVLNIVLSGSLPPDDLYDLAVNSLQQPLQAVPGVASVSVNGGLQEEVQVQLDYTRLTAYNVSPTQVTSTIQRENVDSPGGIIDSDVQTFSVRSAGVAQAPSDLG